MRSRPMRNSHGQKHLHLPLPRDYLLGRALALREEKYYCGQIILSWYRCLEICVNIGCHYTCMPVRYDIGCPFGIGRFELASPLEETIPFADTRPSNHSRI